MTIDTPFHRSPRKQTGLFVEVISDSIQKLHDMHGEPGKMIPHSLARCLTVWDPDKVIPFMHALFDRGTYNMLDHF